MDSAEEVCLVTGGSGLIGSAISKIVGHSCIYKSRKFIFASSRDADLRNLPETRSLFAQCRPSYVIHLAAKVGGLFANMQHKVDFFRDNVFMNDNVLLICKEMRVKKVVSCLSTCIYPDGVQLPIKECDLHQGPPHNSNEGYAYAKRMLEVLSRCYSEQNGCNFVCVAPTNVFGPNDNYSLTDGHVIPSLIHKCFLAKQRGETQFQIMGTGSPRRQFIFSEDLARLILWALDEYTDRLEPLNLSVPPEEERSILYVAKEIARLFGIESVTCNPSQADGQFQKTVSTEKLQRVGPKGFTFTDFDGALRDSVTWFKDNYPDVRK